jgi:SAM-dependent methyltransferase
VTASTDDVLESDTYILRRSEAETARLRAQSKSLEPATLRVLDGAGIAPGMRCLDAGCGPGEVSRLLGRAVGPEGHVTGYDIDPVAGRRMLEATRAEIGPNVAFVQGDITAKEPIAGAPFDLVFARLLLCHMTDPVGAVRHLAAQARPGGRIVLMDYDMTHFSIRPEHPDFARGFEIVTECFRRSGKPADAGLRLGEYIVAAGLPPAEGYLAEPVFGSITRIGPLLDMVLGSLRPAAAALGIAGAEEVERIRAEVQAVTARGMQVAMGPIVIGAWTTKPG